MQGKRGTKKIFPKTKPGRRSRKVSGRGWENSAGWFLYSWSFYPQTSKLLEKNWYDYCNKEIISYLFVPKFQSIIGILSLFFILKLAIFLSSVTEVIMPNPRLGMLIQAKNEKQVFFNAATTKVKETILQLKLVIIK